LLQPFQETLDFQLITLLLLAVVAVAEHRETEPTLLVAVVLAVFCLA
jgi:hypothetical protein